MYKKFGAERGGGPRGPKKFDRGGGDRGGDRPMHDAVCGQCGNACQVPFRPTGSRPVLCRDCFKKDGGGESGGGESRGFNKRSFEKRPFKQFGGDNKIEDRLRFIEMKLDRILAALEGNEEKLF